MSSLTSYISQNIPAILFGIIIFEFVIILFIIEYLNYKVCINKQLVDIKRRIYKLQCKFDDTTNHMKETRTQMELEEKQNYSSLQSYLMDIEKTLSKNMKQNQDSLANLAKSLDSCLINDNQKNQSELSRMEEKLIVLFTEDSFKTYEKNQSELSKMEDRITLLINEDNSKINDKIKTIAGICQPLVERTVIEGGWSKSQRPIMENNINNLNLIIADDYKDKPLIKSGDPFEIKTDQYGIKSDVFGW
jgi:Tfp pilus assembly protein PilE